MLSHKKAIGMSSTRPAAFRSAAAGAQQRFAIAAQRRAPQQRQQRGAHVAAAFNMNKGPDISERVLGALPYLLPLLDTLPYGRFIFLQYPFVARALAPLAPLNDLYHLVPFGPFLIFLGVYSGIVNNRNLGRFTRYNAMQAVLLDILIIIPQLLLNAFGTPRDGPMLQLYISGSNTIFLFVAICTALGMGSCAVGQTARLPLVAEAADTQIRD